MLYGSKFPKKKKHEKTKNKNKTFGFFDNGFGLQTETILGLKRDFGRVVK